MKPQINTDSHRLFNRKQNATSKKLESMGYLASCFLLLTSYFLLLTSESYASVWQKPELIDAETGDAFRTSIAFDPYGNAIAVFEQYTDGVYRIYANRFLPDKGGWQGPVIIDAGPRNAYEARVAFSYSGDAITIFKQSDGNTYRIYVNHFIRSKGWQGPVAIDSGTGDADGHQITFDADGNAAVVFEQKLKGVYRIFANQYRNREGWHGAVAVDKGESNGYFPYPVFDYQGNIYVIYYKEEGGGLEVYISKYEGGKKIWNEPFRLTDSHTVVKQEDWNKKRSDVNRGIKGIYNPLFLSEIKKRIYAGSYTYNLKRFETPSKVDSRFRDAYTPSLIVNKGGEIMAFFVRWDGECQRGYMAVYRDNDGWSKPEIIDVKGGDVEHIRAAVNSKGEMAVVFTQWVDNKQEARGKRQEARNNENLRIHARLYSPLIKGDGGLFGWGEAKIIDAGKKDAYGPNVIYNGDDEIIVIWCQWEVETVKTYRNDYRKGRGWGEAVRVEKEAETCGGCGLRIAASPNGMPIAIFELKAYVKERTKIYAIGGK
ncbi:MAG: hypothetical protein HY096_14000 [Nitrospinae bacterium]|nr:hypothetical protein [Nitrospinota bacterium]